MEKVQITTERVDDVPLLLGEIRHSVWYGKSYTARSPIPEGLNAAYRNGI